MDVLLFYIFATITLVFGGMVVFMKNPVASALSLVVSFVGLAALFITLDAYFIGIIQILVYAGAVMVLFLFIIMLLDIKGSDLKKQSVGAIAGSALVVVVFVGQLGAVLSRTPSTAKTLQETPVQYEVAAQHESFEGVKADLATQTLPDAKLVGETVYHKYPLQLQLMGLLLLAGTIGVVTLSKRQIN